MGVPKASAVTEATWKSGEELQKLDTDTESGCQMNSNNQHTAKGSQNIITTELKINATKACIPVTVQ